MHPYAMIQKSAFMRKLEVLVQSIQNQIKDELERVYNLVLLQTMQLEVAARRSTGEVPVGRGASRVYC